MKRKYKEKDERRENNLVAKHAHKYNKSHTFADRKQKAKRGFIKHKGTDYEY